MMRRALFLIAALVAALVTTTPASAGTAVLASGTFTVDSVQLRSALPLPGGTCLLTATVGLSFRGTLTGGANGPIQVISQAPCDQPPTHGDVFLAPLTFAGVIAGQPARTPLLYSGRTDTTGRVTGTMLTSDPPAALQVQARAGVGGSYTGVVSH